MPIEHFLRTRPLSPAASGQQDIREFGSRREGKYDKMQSR